MNLIVVFELVNWKNKIVSVTNPKVVPGGSSHNLPTRIPEEREREHALLHTMCFFILHEIKS